jgi:DNA invertase Pin-like site-specific DNA recombinase
MAEYERAQILERTRRGRLEKARRGEFLPWAYHCYGYQYLPKRHGCGPQEVADIFRRYGSAYRDAHGVSLSQAQRRVMRVS